MKHLHFICGSDLTGNRKKVMSQVAIVRHREDGQNHRQSILCFSLMLVSRLLCTNVPVRGKCKIAVFFQIRFELCYFFFTLWNFAKTLLPLFLILRLD